MSALHLMLSIMRLWSAVKYLIYSHDNPFNLRMYVFVCDRESECACEFCLCVSLTFNAVNHAALVSCELRQVLKYLVYSHDITLQIANLFISLQKYTL